MNSQNVAKVTFNIEDFLTITTKIIDFFIQSYDRLCQKKTKANRKIVQIQILLEKRELFYKLQIIYCGKTNFNIRQLFEEVFTETLKKLNMERITLGMICSKNEATGYDNEEMEMVAYVQDEFIFVNKKINKSTVQTYWNEYTSLTFKNKINLADVERLVESTKNYISEHKPNYPKIRFVFMKDGHQVMEDSLDPDICSCHSIASAMATIIENSRNEDFRKKCLDMWQVENPHEINKKVFEKLMNHLENKR